jgi:uncharacterized protein YllA (UPF0747 family)
VQLEKVSAQCQKLKSQESQISKLSKDMEDWNEKVQNIGRLVKLQQSFQEAQEEDLALLKQSQSDINLRIDQILKVGGIFEPMPKQQTKDWDKMQTEITNSILKTNKQVLETSLNSWLSKIEA